MFNHYASDEKNTPRQLRMLINVGGGDPGHGRAVEGIHWHMNIANEITYVATDEKRQVIPYVHVKDMQGRVTEYFAKDSPHDQGPDRQSATKHRMDCVDCHNRPTHIYVPPDLSVDNSLLAQRLDVALPFLKQQAVAALTANYDTTDAPRRGSPSQSRVSTKRNIPRSPTASSWRSAPPSMNSRESIATRSSLR